MGAVPVRGRCIGRGAPTGPARPGGGGEMARARVGAVLRLDLIVLCRRGPLLLLPLPFALFIAMDVLAGRLQAVLLASIALGVCAQYAQSAVEAAHLMVRLYGALPLLRSEVVGARWIEGLALVLLSCLVCVPVAALTGDWGGLMAGLVVICLSVALGCAWGWEPAPSTAALRCWQDPRLRYCASRCPRCWLPWPAPPSWAPPWRWPSAGTGARTTERVASERQWRWPVTMSPHGKGVASSSALAGDRSTLPGPSPWTVTLGP